MSSRIGGQFLARRNAGTPNLHAFCSYAMIWEEGRQEIIFQAVAQVNPTAQNTLLLGLHFSSFLVSGCIFFDHFCMKSLVDCFPQRFCSVAIQFSGCWSLFGLLFSVAIWFFDCWGFSGSLSSAVISVWLGEINGEMLLSWILSFSIVWFFSWIWGEHTDSQHRVRIFAVTLCGMEMHNRDK